jgi:hypothetical protein
MATVANIDVKQKLPSSFNINRPNVTSNYLNFDERIHISVNGTLIKTFANHPFFSVNPIIFPKAKL